MEMLEIYEDLNIFTIILDTRVTRKIRELQEAPINLVFEAHTDISVVVRGHLSPNDSWFVYVCRSYWKTNKRRGGFIHPPGTVNFYIIIHTGGSSRVISTEQSTVLES